jgi:hypothetical protein
MGGRSREVVWTRIQVQAYSAFRMLTDFFRHIYSSTQDLSVHLT